VIYEVLFIVGYVLLAIAYIRFWMIVRRNRLRSRFWWEMERVRASLALEGDPGPWEERK
jgi:hypothetical protein